MEKGADTAAQLTNEPDKIGLRSHNFLGLLLTQLLGASNDNTFRFLVIGICTPMVAKEHSSLIVSAGLACITLPYLLLTAPAGYLADRFSKRNVIIACKVAEIFLMAAAVGAIYLSDVLGIYPILAVLLLMGSQSALFSPAKFGSIPEMLPAEKISSANGLMGLITIVSVVAGVVVGNYLVDFTKSGGIYDISNPASRPKGLAIICMSLVGVAVLGTLSSLLIGKLPAANPNKRFLPKFNRTANSWVGRLALRLALTVKQLFVETWHDLRALASNRALLRVSLGIAFFWSLGALAQMNIIEFGRESGKSEVETNPMFAALVIGVGLGSVLAGFWSGGKVELGMLPLGAAGMALGGMALFTISLDMSTGGMLWACFWLFLLGASAGLFDIPLEAYMQHHSPKKSRGSILAASNFISFSGMLAMAGIFWLLRIPVLDPETNVKAPWLDSRQVFLLAGVVTIPIIFYIVWLIPEATLRFVVWLGSKTFYRIKVFGQQNLPEHGGALLVANHVTWLDGVLLLLVTSRPVRMIANRQFVKSWWVRSMARTMQVIPIATGKPSSVRKMLETVREALKRGELVCVFPEGGITRTGELQSFKRGMLSMVEGTGAPIIPVFLDELWGSIFSFHGGRFFWKWPRHLPYPVSVHFGAPLLNPSKVNEVRQAVEQLGLQAAENRMSLESVPPKAFLRNCRRRKRKLQIVDSLGERLTGGQVLLRTLILRRLLLREVLAEEEKYVGILIPPSAGGVIVNAAVPLAGRIGVNLNYTLTSLEIEHCIRECGIRNILTTRAVMKNLTKKFKLEINAAKFVYLDDLRKKITFADKLSAVFMAKAMPMRMLQRRLGVDKIRPDDVLTVIFTSGSTGMPKGVMLTHRNIGSNVLAVNELIHLSDSDVIAGTLPFFHSLGYTTTLWTVLMLDASGAYHFSPLDYKIVGKLCHDAKATILITTPTFLRGYLKRCQPDQFETLDVVVAGAEKLPAELRDAFENKFGVRPVEGYGTTELSPLVSVNVPIQRLVNDELRLREGSVGRAVPGVEVKIIDLDSEETLPTEHEGMLLVRGPNVMKGYLNHPEKTMEVMREGWYVTGDIAKLDADGFIHITGRLSRFSKIGGEMVPHVRIEDEIQRIIGKDDEVWVAVTATPDERKGERLIVFHRKIDKDADQIRKELAEAGLPNLFIPSRNSFCEVDEIPLLGTGKLDLKALKQKALDRFHTPQG